MNLLETTILGFDLETTGVDAGSDRIVELGLACAVNGEPAWTTRTLVNPGIPIPAESTAIHKIDDAAIQDAPTWAAVSQTFIRHLCGDAMADADPWADPVRPVLVGYNAVAFDAPFINAEQKRNGCGPLVDPSMVIDPFVWISWHMRAGVETESGRRSRRLVDVCEHFGVRLVDAHSAAADAAATVELLLAFVRGGMVPDAPEELLAKQRVLQQRLELERSEWGHYLYLERDRWTSDPPQAPLGSLRLGFGKHAGSLLVEHGDYAAFCLERFGDELPDAVHALFGNVAS